MPQRNSFDIFDRFSEGARKTLISAQLVAGNMQSDVGAQHILIALASIGETIAYSILRNNMISADQIRLILGVSTARKNSNGGLSPSGRLVLKRAVMLATKYQHASIDSEHLLMACISSPDLISYQIVAQLGVDPEKIKMELMETFDDLRNMDKVIREKLSQMQNAMDALLQGGGAPHGAPAILPGKTRRKKSRTPAIDFFTVDLTAQARAKKLDAVVGREQEIKRTMEILVRKTKNNPVFVGDPGVGKTALAEGVAQLIADGKVPKKLLNKRILTLDLALLVAGAVYRGQFEERIKKLLDEISAQKNIILFIDEIHTIVGTGSAEGAMDAANILKPALSAGRFRVIGATTTDEYRKYIEKDSALDRRLQKIYVSEPSAEQTIAILKGLRPSYEKFHNVHITDDAINASVEYAERFVAERFLPDKAIDIIDEACAAQAIMSNTLQPQDIVAEIEGELKKINVKKEEAVRAENYPQAVTLRKQEEDLKKKISAIKKNQALPLTDATIDRKEVAKVVSTIAGIPLDNLLSGEREKLLLLEKRLKQFIIAQDQAVNEVASAIKRSKIGLSEGNKPVGSFIFLGPTGVGKTELAKVLAREIFNSEEALIRVDMSEFMEKHNISRLLGAPPGYVGYEEAGKLTEAIRRRPYSVVLFDEIEKAHPDFFNVMLQILDDGHVTDGQGRKVSFRNSIIIMTGNIGLKEYHSTNAIGFNKKNKYSDFEAIKGKILKSVDAQMRPEFINRVDKIIVFKPLNKSALEKIVLFELKKLATRLKSRENITLTFEKNISRWLVEVGTDPQFGARPIKRAIDNHIGNTIAEFVVKNPYSKKIHIDISKEKVVVKEGKNVPKAC
ncbi:MAG TPA: ATP-dependent Clp protease ATP-binding subunit [bacterium]|nr:ATP-dependent Clp protease ATP-binding subunit [bacterium]